MYTTLRFHVDGATDSQGGRPGGLGGCERARRKVRYSPLLQMRTHTKMPALEGRLIQRGRPVGKQEHELQQTWSSRSPRGREDICRREKLTIQQVQDAVREGGTLSWVLKNRW